LETFCEEICPGPVVFYICGGNVMWVQILAARDYALILGMPGTGKTSTIVHAVNALLARGASVLLTSYTNSAVDNILLKLKMQNVDFVRVGRTDAIHPELWGHVINGPGSLFLSPKVPKTCWEEVPFFLWVFLYLFSSLFDHISLQHRRYPLDLILFFFPQ
jgi:Cdc6-like AAA superfamily ATPase